jgi:hypothetical protein
MGLPQETKFDAIRLGRLLQVPRTQRRSGYQSILRYNA